jgi:anionic cell wall polymer biosynthesis LytR-Cps2A-Psr (LCP) family protein
MPIKPTDQALAARELAELARQLASALTDRDDIARILRSAQVIEAKAADLDRSVQNAIASA